MSAFPPPSKPLPPPADVGTVEGRAVLLERGLRPVLFSEELANGLADRVDWGEPDADGWYTPTLYRNHALTLRRYPDDVWDPPKPTSN